MPDHRLPTAEPLLVLRGVTKSFRLHLRGGVELPVVRDVSFSVGASECVVLGGPSGIGKSSILRMAYGNYGIDAGEILVRDRDGTWRDLGRGDARLVLALRAARIASVSQFLRAVPRVSARDVVAEPLLARGVARAAARHRASDLLARLNLPPALHDLPPATFSGGEKQRVNIARGFLTDHPILLLDEPTASLDAENRDVVAALIGEKLRAGTAILGIFHDEALRMRVATRTVDVAAFSARRVAA